MVFRPAELGEQEGRRLVHQHDALQGKLHVLRRHRRAGLEFEVRADLEGEGLAVRRYGPGLGDAADQLAQVLRLVAQQPIVDVRADLDAGQLVALARIEGDDVVDLLGEDGGVLWAWRRRRCVPSRRMARRRSLPATGAWSSRSWSAPLCGIHRLAAVCRMHAVCRDMAAACETRRRSAGTVFERVFSRGAPSSSEVSFDRDGKQDPGHDHNKGKDDTGHRLHGGECPRQFIRSPRNSPRAAKKMTSITRIPINLNLARLASVKPLSVGRPAARRLCATPMPLCSLVP